MAREIPLIPGAKYYAGADLPFYVSRAMVTSYLAARGFQGIIWHDRDEPLPASLDPSRDPQYSNDWSEWAEASYTGTGSGVLSPPASPAWLRVELPATTAQTPPAVTPGTPSGQLPPLASATVAPASIVTDPTIAREKRLGVAATVFGGALVVGGLFWTLRQRRSALEEVQPDVQPTRKAPPAKRR